mgnify:FL=1
MTVNKVYLLLICGIVWIIAGFNVFRIGFTNYTLYISPLSIILSALVFFIFLFVIFLKIVNKHEKHIMQYQKKGVYTKIF